MTFADRLDNAEDGQQFGAVINDLFKHLENLMDKDEDA